MFLFFQSKNIHTTNSGKKKKIHLILNNYFSLFFFNQIGLFCHQTSKPKEPKELVRIRDWKQRIQIASKMEQRRNLRRGTILLDVHQHG